MAPRKAIEAPETRGPGVVASLGVVFRTARDELVPLARATLRSLAVIFGAARAEFAPHLRAIIEWTVGRLETAGAEAIARGREAGAWLIQAAKKTSMWLGTHARATLVAFVVVVSMGVFGVGMLLSSTYGASQVADNARQLHWTNATLGTTGIARAAVAQAAFFTLEVSSSDESKALAIAEARESLDAVTALQPGPPSADSPELAAAISDYVDTAGAIVADLESGHPGRAERTRLETLEPMFAGLSATLGAMQGDLAEAIAESDRMGGRISRVTFVAISFLIPALTMTIFWLILRVRVRRREREMRMRLESEREFSRAKDEFLAGLSHELRTPLTSIVGFSEMLMDDRSINEDAREQLTLIHASSSDLTRMVEDLLTAARLDADALTVAPQAVDLAEQVGIASATFSLTGRSFASRVPPMTVYADPLLVRQIVHNLLSNALRHGGPEVVVTASSKAGWGYLVIADNGPGVAPELEPTLFKRFIHEGRQALTAGSVGLGLAISHELAHRMGGSLSYKRADGWTTFTLKLRSLPSAGDQEFERDDSAAVPAS